MGNEIGDHAGDGRTAHIRSRAEGAMSIRLTLRVRNASAIVANFYAADERAQRAIRRVVKTHGKLTKELAQFLCPVDTGFMRAHLRTIFSNDGYSYQTGWLEEEFTKAGLPFYPPFQEFGTSKMAAQPCLFPADAHVRPQFTVDLRARLREALERRTSR